MALKAGRVGVNPNYVDKEGRPLYDNSYLKELLRKEGIITLFTKEGNPISIDNAVAGRVYDLVVTMAPKQAGTGTPSPTNVRAISGFNSVTVSVNSADTEVTFDSTVYGGILDLITGVLTAEYGMLSEDSFETVSTRTSSGGLYYIDYVFDTPISTDILCNMLPKKSGDAAWASETPCITVGYSSPEVFSVRLYVQESTLESFKSAYDGLQICYLLATPTTVQLTAQAIALLTGANTVSSDTGTTMDLKYLGTLVPGGANGRSLNRSLNLNREVIDTEERKEIQEEIKEEIKEEVPVEEPVTVKKSSKKSTK